MKILPFPFYAQGGYRMRLQQQVELEKQEIQDKMKIIDEMEVAEEIKVQVWKPTSRWRRPAAVPLRIPIKNGPWRRRGRHETRRTRKK
jgi:hypothetical protein